MKKNEIYEKNIEALSKKSEILTKWLKEEKEIDWYSTFNGQDGTKNLYIHLPSGNIPAYDPQDALKEPKETCEKFSLHKEDITIQVGIGLGHVLKIILEKKDKEHKVLVIEPIASLVNEAFCTYDFTPWIEDNSFLLINNRKEEIQIALGIFEGALVVENWNLVFEKYINLRLDDYQEYAQKVIESLQQIRCNTGTVMAVGNTLADNDISNLPYVINSRGIDEIKDLFKGFPIVCVSTGPSFIKNVHWLKNIQNKIIIIAVAQALRPLLAYDIRPDFICTVDFGEPNMGHLKGLFDSDVPLICLNRTYAPLLKGYSGPKFIVSSIPKGMDITAAGIISDKGTLEQGGSVAHMALGLAYHIGGNPIMIIGQDLSLGETSHTPLADVAGNVKVVNGQILWEVKDQRSNLKGVDHSMGDVILVPGYLGGQILTNIGLASFITSFNNIVERANKEIEVINCTEGGADIKSMKKSSFKKAIDKYCTRFIDKSVLNKYLTDAENTDELIDKTIPLLKKDISNLNHIIDNCKKGLRTCDQMWKANKKKGDERVNKLSYWQKKNFKYSQEAFKYTVFNPLVSVAIYSASRKIQSHALNVSSKTEDLNRDPELLKTRIDRNKLILNSALKASEALLVPYRKALALLTQYRSTKDKSLIKSPITEEIDLNDVDSYFDNNNFAHPYVDAIRILAKDPYNEKALEVRNKALSMRQRLIDEHQETYKMIDQILDYTQCLMQSRTSGKNKDYDNALWCLQEAQKIKPDQEEVLWGLATTYHFMKKNEEASQYYKQLIEKYPSSPNMVKYTFELGQVLLMLGNAQDGLKAIGEAMARTNDYNYFYEKLGTLFEMSKLYKEALTAYEQYIKFFPNDEEVKVKIEKLKEQSNSEIIS